MLNLEQLCALLSPGPRRLRRQFSSWHIEREFQFCCKLLALVGVFFTRRFRSDFLPSADMFTFVGDGNQPSGGCM